MALGAVVALSAAWLAVLTVLVLDMAGVWRRGAHFRWQGAGVLLEISYVLASAFGDLRGWPRRWLDVLHMSAFPVLLAAVALFVVGTTQKRFPVP
jgi:hypothetical protein